MAANCGWPHLSLPSTFLKHSLLRLFYSSKSFFQNTVGHVKGISYYVRLLGDVISVQGLADVANIWERLPRNSDHQRHTPEYWVIFEGGGSAILVPKCKKSEEEKYVSPAQRYHIADVQGWPNREISVMPKLYILTNDCPSRRTYQ